MIILVVTGNIDPSALEELIAACASYHRIRAEQAAGQDGAAGLDGGTEQAGLKNYCYWHHHVMLHQLGWTLTVHPDGTSQVRSPGGKIIGSHGPPPRPGNQLAQT